MAGDVRSNEPIIGNAVALGEPTLREVQYALSRLPDEQREVLALVALEGLSYREVAAALETPVGTVVGRLTLARAALVAQLETGHAEE